MLPRHPEVPAPHVVPVVDPDGASQCGEGLPGEVGAVEVAPAGPGNRVRHGLVQDLSTR